MKQNDVYKGLERIRKQKGLTEKMLCKGIVSERTYRRYLYQETEMPFFVLSELTKKMNMNVYTFLYDVSHYVDSTHINEIKLLDLLVTDRFDEANALLHTMERPFQSSSNQFLLPLMLLRLDVINGERSKKEVDKTMIQALHLDALMKLPFITVDHLKLIEHLFLTFNENELSKALDILTQIIKKDKKIVFSSDYSMMKCHQLYIHGLILTHASIQTIQEAFIHAITYSYRYGGLMIVDELMILMREQNIDTKDKKIQSLMESFYLSAAFMYHMNDISDDKDDIDYLKQIGIQKAIAPIYLKSEVFK